MNNRRRMYLLIVSMTLLSLLSCSYNQIADETKRLEVKEKRSEPVSNVTKEVKFGRTRFRLQQGAITIINIVHIVSETSETVGSPGLIDSMPYWYVINSNEKRNGINLVCASVYFDVNFPESGRIYYKWVDVTYRYRAGNVNEIRHAYLDLEGFMVE